MIAIETRARRHWEAGDIAPNNSPRLYTEVLYTVLFKLFFSRLQPNLESRCIPTQIYGMQLS